MDQAKIDRIEVYVREHGECTEEEIMAALGLSLFDVLEGLDHLERVPWIDEQGNKRIGKLRSEIVLPPSSRPPIF